MKLGKVIYTTFCVFPHRINYSAKRNQWQIQGFQSRRELQLPTRLSVIRKICMSEQKNWDLRGHVLELSANDKAAYKRQGIVLNSYGWEFLFLKFAKAQQQFDPDQMMRPSLKVNLSCNLGNFNKVS